MNALDLSEVAATKATHRFARLSATKARAVLDLMRDLDVDDARDVLRHTERGAADVVSKVLESAVANAGANHFLDPDALYVAECWADEGPTLRRFRPRARGRATRINKRTCHITVVVAMLDPEELAERERSRAATGGRAADRAARVAASRQARGAAGGDATTDASRQEEDRGGSDADTSPADDEIVADVPDDEASEASDVAEEAENAADDEVAEASEVAEEAENADDEVEPADPADAAEEADDEDEEA